MDHRRVRDAPAQHTRAQPAREHRRAAGRTDLRDPASRRASPPRGDRSQGARPAERDGRLRGHTSGRRHAHRRDHRRLHRARSRGAQGQALADRAERRRGFGRLCERRSAPRSRVRGGLDRRRRRERCRDGRGRAHRGPGHGRGPAVLARRFRPSPGPRARRHRPAHRCATRSAPLRNVRRSPRVYRQMGPLGWWGRFVYRRKWVVLVVSIVTPDSAPAASAAGLRSKDGKRALANVTVKGTTTDAEGFFPELRALVRTNAFEVLATGNIPLNGDIDETLNRDLQRAELVSLPLAFILLLLVFGSAAAAILTLGVGILVIVAGLGATFALARATDVSQYALNIVTLIGLGVAIDYSLFIVSRFREELARGRTVEDAVGIALGKIGRAHV